MAVAIITHHAETQNEKIHHITGRQLPFYRVMLFRVMLSWTPPSGGDSFSGVCDEPHTQLALSLSKHHSACSTVPGQFVALAVNLHCLRATQESILQFGGFPALPPAFCPSGSKPLVPIS